MPCARDGSNFSRAIPSYRFAETIFSSLAGFHRTASPARIRTPARYADGRKDAVGRAEKRGQTQVDQIDARQANCHVTIGDDAKPRGSAIATNVFLRTPSGWRMVMHHSSPAPTTATGAHAGPLH